MHAFGRGRVLTDVSAAPLEAQAPQRPCARGKFLFCGDQKLYIRGVTYGPFRPNASGCEYGEPQDVARDFAQMAEHGINAVRVYTVPPRWLLDLAHQQGLWVMVGLPWEQHITFLDDRATRRRIEQRVREGVHSCAGHPALLCFTVGNEIPADIVRWYGRKRIERYLHRLYLAAKAEDPGCLVTYVNYPSTEYLHLPFVDFVCFNVYLETKEKLESYLARLANIAADRPLVIAEVGLDSLRNGQEGQAETLKWQLEGIYASGAAGAFVFAWTDQWYRGGLDIDDWDFGLTDRARKPKPALEAVRAAFEAVPFATEKNWPLISVVVCTYNGSRTIRESLEGLRRLEYPRFEVIVVDDGSHDGVGDIVRHYDVRLIRTENRGLSNARNTGLLAARGEIVAYLDDDAIPDPQWLTYLAATFESSSHVAVGGPNIAPPWGGMIANCVARSPGGPIHVLLADQLAEHIPGCNMAFRRSALLEIGGFDPSLRIAGDDVDVCWRIDQRGWTIGFSPAAMVWHHRRNSARAYWRQQFHYGRAEALLERKWPEKYNTLGHPSWAGRVYGKALSPFSFTRSRIYHGTWGSALFQSVYESGRGTLASLPITPEWYLVILILASLSLLGVIWPAMMVMLPLAITAAAIPVLESAAAALHEVRRHGAGGDENLWKRRGLVWWLHLVQPAARLLGRLSSGLTPMRLRTRGNLALPRRRWWAIWSETWKSSHDRLREIESLLSANRTLTLRGGDFDHWDLQVIGGPLGAVRLKMVIEEHGTGRQMVRVAAWPSVSRWAVGAMLTLSAIGTLGLVPGLSAFGVFFAMACGVAAIAAQEAAAAMGALNKAMAGNAPTSRTHHFKQWLADVSARYQPLVPYVRRQWRTLVVIVCLSLVTPILGALAPWPMKVLVDHALGQETISLKWLPADPYWLIWIAAAASLALFLISSVLDAIMSWAWSVAGQRMVYELAGDLFKKLQRLSPSFHSRNSVGDLLSRITGDAWGLYGIVESVLVSPGQSLFGLVLVVSLAWMLDPALAMVSLAVAPMLALVAVTFGPALKKRAKRGRQTESKLFSLVHQTMSSIPLVQTFGTQTRNREQFVELADSAVSISQRGVLLKHSYALVTGLLTTIGVAVVLYLGTRRVISGAMSVGSLLVFIAYIRTMQSSVQALLQTHGTIKATEAKLDRVLEVLRSDQEIPEKADARTLLRDREHGVSVRFENVTFGYEPARPVLHQVNLEAKPGQMIAIVGPTGAGKSTLLALLPRLFDPWQGRVLLGGQDLRSLKLADVRDAVSVVPQEPLLLPISITDNIAYGAPGASVERIKEVAEVACAAEFIEKLPQGYETVIGERGSTLSAGQRQRLAIARALLRDASVLVLDEPTSALDAQSEHWVMEGLKRLCAGRTCFVIAHRLSTVKQADLVVVLQGGRIAEMGSPQELAVRGSPWSPLAAHDCVSEEVAP